MKKVFLAVSIIILVICAGCNNASTEKTSAPSSHIASVDEVRALRGEYFDFAVKNRLDYMPVFSEGNAPSDSKEYLFYAFVLNMDNWGDEKGTMKRDYVEQVINKHFEVKNINHSALKNDWNYDGEKYVAVPKGIGEMPIFVLRKFSTYPKDNKKMYEITIDFCMYDDHIPSEQEMKEIRERMIKGNLSKLRDFSPHTFVYYINPDSNEVVFVSHTLSEKQ